MSKDKTPPPPANNRALEDALRANLLKRKQQQRARDQADNTPQPTDKESK